MNPRVGSGWQHSQPAHGGSRRGGEKPRGRNGIREVALSDRRRQLQEWTCAAPSMEVGALRAQAARAVRVRRWSTEGWRPSGRRREALDGREPQERKIAMRSRASTVRARREGSGGEPKVRRVAGSGLPWQGRSSGAYRKTSRTRRTDQGANPEPADKVEEGAGRGQGACYGRVSRGSVTVGFLPVTPTRPRAPWSTPGERSQGPGFVYRETLKGTKGRPNHGGPTASDRGRPVL